MWYRRDVTGRRLAQRPSCREKGTTPNSSAGLPRLGTRSAARGLRRGRFGRSGDGGDPAFFRRSSLSKAGPRCETEMACGAGTKRKTPAKRAPGASPPQPSDDASRHHHHRKAVENTTSLATLFKTAAAATDRPTTANKGLGARERWRCRSSFTPLPSSSSRTRRRDDGGGGGAHHSPRNGRARMRDKLPSSVRSCASDGDGGGGGGGGDDAPPHDHHRALHRRRRRRHRRRTGVINAATARVTAARAQC